MDIFKEIKDIEKIYENLITSAKGRNLREIELFRAEQQQNFELFISNKNELVNNVLGNLSKEVDKKIQIFEESLGEAINKIENQFQKSIAELQNMIIEKVEFDF
jgi:hypothetical protein